MSMAATNFWTSASTSTNSRENQIAEKLQQCLVVSSAGLHGDRRPHGREEVQLHHMMNEVKVTLFDKESLLAMEKRTMHLSILYPH